MASFVEAPELEVVVCHAPSGAPIGAICVAGVDTVNRKAELSAGFLRGRGTRAVWEAIHFTLDYCFERIGLRKLVMYALAGNRQAIAILERAGAHPEGVLRAELALPGGEYADLLRYALFSDADWPRLKSELVRIAPLATRTE